MFRFLKDKLKSAISKISESVEKEGKVEEKVIEKPLEEAKKDEEKGFFAKLKDTFTRKKEEKEAFEEDEYVEEKSEEAQSIKEIEKKRKELLKRGKRIESKELKQEAILEKPKIEIKSGTKSDVYQTIHEQPEKKGFFATLTEKIITTKINEEQFERLFWDLELALMENNIAIEVIEKIKNDMKEQLVEKPITRTKIQKTIQETLKTSIEDLFKIQGIDLIQEIKNKKEKPYVIAFFGINGSGKTTSIAKIAHMLKNKNISCVLAASDTFRAASIEQLQQHADKIGVKVIKHSYGSDPAAVAFDAIKHAKAKNIGVVLIDTAGRMHSNTNLLEEIKKIIRVAKPDLRIFIGESITGNDCIEQAKIFNDVVGIDGIILAKADVDEKGGAAVSVSYVTKKPILYLGTGQKYSDLQAFDSEFIIKNLGLV